MCFDKIKLSYKKLCAKTIYLDKSESSPIIFDDYNENDYYYVINDNYNYIYSQDELYEILKKDTIDPFTRLPMVKYSFVKIRFNN
jgi:hypothetical protein